MITGSMKQRNSVFFIKQHTVGGQTLLQMMKFHNPRFQNMEEKSRILRRGLEQEACAAAAAATLPHQKCALLAVLVADLPADRRLAQVARLTRARALRGKKGLTGFLKMPYKSMGVRQAF